MSDPVVLSLLSAIGLTTLGFIATVLKDWIKSINRNTTQVELLNQKLEFFVHEIETLRIDVNDLKLWRARFESSKG